ncbi:MAG: helix-turn-helix domain-containing protein [Niabella sp.]
MEKVLWQLATPSEYIKVLNRQIPSKIVGKKFVLSEDIGEGFLEYLDVQEGLWAEQLQFMLHREVVLNRTPKEKNDMFVIDFYLSDSEIIRELMGKTYKLGFHHVNITLVSATTSAILKLPANDKIKKLSILFTKDWLTKNILVDHAIARDYFSTNEPLYVSEDMDYKLNEYLNKIDFDKNNRITTISYILQILDYLFERVTRRNLEQQSREHIHPEDLNNLLAVRQQLDTDIDIEFSLEKFAKQSNMSLSKFKRLFKQVLGVTPYQYYLSNRMEKAKEAIETSQCSISEIGFLLGYANLSQFSKAFKKQFGILPSELRKNSVF